MSCAGLLATWGTTSRAFRATSGSTTSPTRRRCAKQVGLARAAGLSGFAFYYYWFDGKRLLEQPLEAFLANPTIDFPFCLAWANENWTRRWDGEEREILVEQVYDETREGELVDDLQRHFADQRYIRVDGRPLLVAYRADIIPDAGAAVARWRTLWRERHDENPLIFMAQTFGSEDPRRVRARRRD